MFDFQSGDIIEWCGDQYLVHDNYGNSGTVQEYFGEGNLGTTISNFYWEYIDEVAVLISRNGEYV